MNRNLKYIIPLVLQFPLNKLFILFVFLFVVVLAGIAQTDLKPGSIITNRNDTVVGYIDNRGAQNNARKCMFIQHKEDEPCVTYLPGEIMAYRFTDGKYYISKTINTGESSEWIFLEYLINGTVDIYYYRDVFGDHFFIDKGDNNLLPLKNEDKEITVNGVKYKQESNSYIGVLKYIFHESPAISAQAEGVSLNHKSLVNITRKYDLEFCKDTQCIIYEKKVPQVIFYIGPLIGLNINQIVRVGNDFRPIYYYFTDSKWKIMADPSAGVCFKLNIPALNDRFYIEYDITVNRFHTSSTTISIETQGSVIRTNEMSYTHYSVNNVLLFKYEFNAGKFCPVIMGGAFLNNLFSADYTRKTEWRIKGHGAYYTGVDDENLFGSMIYGLTAGVGCTFKINRKYELFADLKYFSGLGLFPYLVFGDISVNIGFPIKL
jgi:hypothetical protein